MASLLQSKVEEWLSLDKNETTRAEIEELWKTGNTDELDRRLSKRIEFGTAGPPSYTQTPHLLTSPQDSEAVWKQASHE
ncbi:Phosphoglucomutase-3 [Ceratobasidium sp. 394]|nr:Phosphoglucomutase-3 [Ceratobasidium sp. 394]